jgi:WD40-like Beta Propeller Repeat
MSNATVRTRGQARLSGAVTALVVIAALAMSSSQAGAATRVVAQSQGTTSPYFSSQFTVSDNSYTFGQAPTFTSTGQVLSQENDPAGVRQVYRSDPNGSNMTCLTCGRLPGPNGFAAERPSGGWVLFCSYGDQPLHYGGPGLGGYGGDLYVMRENGSDPTRLTVASDPNGGADFDVPGGVPYDNYHPYWSPDGRHIAWVRTEAYPLSEGGQRWEIMLADFVAPKGGAPHLADVRVVGPAYGVYETQQWAPNGSGILFTAFGPRNSPYQSTPPGWMHQELYFMRLYGPGVSPAHPLVTAISDDLPVYEEQAVFTPDMRDVVFMTNRNASDGSWYDAVIAVAQRTKFDAPLAGSSGAPQFLADFTDPNFRSDLYMVDVRTHAVRELTDFSDEIVPEFDWGPGHHQLLWSAEIAGTGRFRTQVGTFSGVTGADRTAPPRSGTPWLTGRPIEMARVGGAPPPPSPPSSSSGSPAAPAPPGSAIPPVVGTYATLWLSQLSELGAAASTIFSHPPIS